MPRLSPIPLAAVLRLEGPAGGVRSLILETRARSRLSAELLPAFAPLRFAAGEGAGRTIVVEAQVAGEWTPVIVAPLGSTGPLVCHFDLISEDCR